MTQLNYVINVLYSIINTRGLTDYSVQVDRMNTSAPVITLFQCTQILTHLIRGIEIINSV